MAEVTIKEGKTPLKKPVKQKAIWWRVLLSFLGGFLAFPLTLAGAGVIAATMVNMGQLVSMTGANPDDVLTADYQQKSLLNAVKDIISGGIKDLEDIEKITPLAETMVYDKIVETLTNYGVAVKPDGTFAIDWDELKTKEFVSGSESPIGAYALACLLSGTYPKVVLEKNEVDLGMYYPLFKYILFDITRDESGEPILDVNGNYTVDTNNPFTLEEVIAADGPVGKVGNYLTIAEVLEVMGQTPSGFLEAIKDWRVSTITSEKIMGLKLAAILGESTIQNNQLLKAIDGLFEGGATINDLTTLDQEKFMGLELVAVLGAETVQNNQLLSAVNDMYDGEATIGNLMDESTIYELTIGDVLGSSTSSNHILSAIADVPIGKLSNKVDTLSLGELIGTVGGKIFEKESIASIRISQLSNLSDTLKSQLTLGDVMNIDSSDVNTPEILKQLNDTVLEADPMNPKVDQKGVYTIPFCALDAPNPETQEFKEWRINSTTGTVVYPNDEILLNSNITLYPMWQDISSNYSVSFDKGAGEGEMDMIETVHGRYKIPRATFNAPEGKQFKSWTYDDEHMNHIEGLNFNDVIIINDDTGNVTLTAQYEDIQDKIEVRFLGNGGSGKMRVRKVFGSYVIPDCFYTAPSGQRFSHWEFSDNGGDTWTSLKGKYVVRIDSHDENTDYVFKAIWETIPTEKYTVTFDKNGGSKKEDIQSRIRNIKLKEMMSIPSDSPILTALAETYPLIGDDPEDGKTSLNEKVQTLRLKDIVTINHKKFIEDSAITDAASYDSELASKGKLYKLINAIPGGINFKKDKIYYALDTESGKYVAQVDVYDKATYEEAASSLVYFEKSEAYELSTTYCYTQGEDSSAIMISLRNCFPMLTTSTAEKESLNDAVARLKNTLTLKDVFDESSVGSEGILRTLWDSTDGGDFPISDISAAISGGTGVSGRVYSGVSFTEFLGDSMYEKDGGGDFITKDIDTAWTSASDMKTYKKLNSTWWYLLVPGDETTKSFYETNPEEKFFVVPPSADYKLTSSSLSQLVTNMKNHMETDSITDLSDAGFISLDATATSKLDGIYGGKKLGDRNVTSFVDTVLNHLQDVVYTIEIVPNGGTGSMSDISGTLISLATTKVPSCTLTHSEKSFQGWYIYNKHTNKYYDLSGGTGSDTPTLIVPDGLKAFGTSVIGGGYQLIAQWA